MNWIKYKLFQLQAAMLLVFGRKEAALAHFTEMMAHFPGDAYAAASRAHMNAQLGYTTNAIADYEALLQKAGGKNGTYDASHANAWFNLGYLYDSLERNEKAETAFRKATALDAKLDRAWYGLALSLIKKKDFAGAVDALKVNTKLQPMSPYGWYQLARVHVDREEPQEALKVIRHLRGFEPKFADQLVRETGLSA